MHSDWEVVEAGEATIASHGTPLPDSVLESIRRNKIALKGPITTQLPASFLQLHRDASIFVDLDAASDLRAASV